MRAQEAFIASAAGGTGETTWAAAVGGSQEALAEIAAWLQRDGLVVVLKPRRIAADGAGAALATLLRAGAVPAQIAAARYGDFSRGPDANGAGPQICWRTRRCGWAQARDVILSGDSLDAWRTVVRWCRVAPPSPEDLLLAPRGGKPWTARAVRHAAHAGAQGEEA